MAVGVKKDGGFARYCVVPSEQVYQLPPNVSLEQGALCEPLSCILHGWNRLKAAAKIGADTKVIPRIWGYNFCPLCYYN